MRGSRFTPAGSRMRQSGLFPYGRLGELFGLPVYDSLGVHTKMSDVRCVTVIAFAGLLAPAYAQWVHPDPRTPRTRDGKPILKAPAPRQDGKPDLSGVWQ